MSKLLAFITSLLFLVSTTQAQTVAGGPQLRSLDGFGSGEFRFESVKSIYWSQIAKGTPQSVAALPKTWVSGVLYLPKNTSTKVPAMIVMHGIGGLYTVDGKKRTYWEYAEFLAENGIAALIVDSHGARGVGVTSQLGSTEVSVYTFVADAFSGADMLRTHPAIDSDRIGIMGFSKGGMTTLLATDKRFVQALTVSGKPFKAHMPIYPGCQNFPENIKASGAPVHMLLGEKDNFTGTSGCYEIEGKLKAAGTSVSVTSYPGAYHSWDESFRPFKSDDISSEDCRWTLKDDGSVWGGGKLPLTNSAEGDAYFRSCSKKATVYVGRDDSANRASRRSVIDFAKKELLMP